MGFDDCGSCGHVFTKEDGDIPHADGGFMEVNHGGGECRKCYMKWHQQCECGAFANMSMKFCYDCGTEYKQSNKKEV